MDIRYAIDDYDSDGNTTERGLFLCVGSCSVNIGETIESLDDIIQQLQGIREEIKENYPNV